MCEHARVRAELDALARGAGLVRTAGPDVFRARGAKILETLQSIVSQDVRKLRPGDGTLALLLAPTGHFRALMGVYAEPEGLLLVAPRGRGPALAAALGRYLALSRCALEPLPTVASIGLFGPMATDIASRCGADGSILNAGGLATTGAGDGTARFFAQSFEGLLGCWVTGAAGVVGAIAVAARGAGAVEVSVDTLELARIGAGFPAWGAELTETVLPPETGIERQAISYTKGCYIGQETMARLRTYGRVNRTLVAVRQTGGAEGAPLLPAELRVEGDARPRGVLTSWRAHPDIDGVALALVRREHIAPGTVLVAADRAFEIAPLPLLQGPFGFRSPDP